MLKFFFFFIIFICFSFTFYLPTLSQARYYLTSTTVGDLAIFAGGCDQSNCNSFSSQIDIYNYSSNSWYIFSLSQPRANLAATTISNLAMFVSGYNSNGTTPQIDIYNYSSSSWYTEKLTTIGRYNLVATTVNNLAFFAGGKISNYQTSNLINIFNYTSNTWTTTTLSQSRSSLSATTVENLAIFAGGTYCYNEVCDYSAIVDIYNYSSNSWSNASLSQARDKMAATTVYNLAFFVGGMYCTQSSGNGCIFFSLVDIYNYSSNRWTTTTLSQSRSSLSATTVENLAIFSGGYNENGSSSRIDIYNYSSNLWFILTLVQPVYDLSSITIKNIGLIAGGWNGSNLISSQINIYILCDLGMYISNKSFPQCTSCLPGTYSDVIASSLNSLISCIPCKAGTYSNITGSNSSFLCSSCPVGTYSQIGSSLCTLCPSGTYSENIGSFICLNCSKGTTSVPGSNRCYPENSYNILIIIIPIIIFIILIILVMLFLYSRKNKYKLEMIEMNSFISKNDLENLKLISNVEIKERLGGGNFGEVYKGIWNKTTEVALKKLKSKEQFQQFIQETGILKTLNHPNIVRFLGVFNSPSNEPYIVMEYLSKGSLDQVLIIEKNILKTEDLLSMSKHAAAGMEYLESNKILHRDLSLRNLLVAPGNNENEKYIIKISDFGLSKIMEKDYYKTDNKTMPIRWSAPEVLEKGIFSSKSDVWSFGIVLWEIFTFGKLPYFQFPTNSEVIEKVVSGYRLEKPENCLNEIYELMLQCWNKNPQERPSFKELYIIITNIQKKNLVSIISNKNNIDILEQDNFYNNEN